MATYRFAGGVYLAEFEATRRAEEREQEDVYSNFHHHANPLRGMYDCLKFEAFVDASRQLTPEEEGAFKHALNRSMEEFQYHFRQALQKLRSMKEKL